MPFSPLHIRMAREALRDYWQSANGHMGPALTWPELIGAICEFTDFDVIDFAREKNQTEKQALYNLSEAISHFVIGYRNKRGFRTPNNAFLSAIFDFLSHPEINKLTLEDDPGPTFLTALQIKKTLILPHRAAKIEQSIYKDSSTFVGVTPISAAHFVSLKELNELAREDILLSYCHISLATTDHDAVRYMEYQATTPVENMSRKSNPARLEFMSNTYRGYVIFASPATALCIISDTLNGDVEMRNLAFIYHPSGQISLSFVPSLLEYREGADCPFSNSRLEPFKDSQSKSIISQLHQNMEGPFMEAVRQKIARLLPIDQDTLALTRESFFLDIRRANATSHLAAMIAERNIQQQDEQQDQQEQEHQEQQEQQEQIDEIEKIIRYAMDEQSQEPDRSQIATTTLLKSLKKRSLVLMAYNMAAGARLDKLDEVTGINGLHMLAHMGSRSGIRIALRYLDRCDFDARDTKGHRASYHAAVFADDPVLSRFLRIKERCAAEESRPSPPILQ